jgi:hypothetical protein
MPDKEKYQQSTQRLDQNADIPAAVLSVLDNAAFPAALLDVLVRGIELAKQKPEGVSDPGDPGDAKELFCAFAYAVPGQGCFLGYWKPAQ